MNAPPPHDRLSTGVAGLDAIIEGGLPRGGVYLVAGSPGAGKTVLANQICFDRAASGERTVYLTLLTESHDRMLAHLRRFEFFDPALISERVYYASAFASLESGGLGGVLTTVRKVLSDRKATFLVVDGFASMREAALSDREFKKSIHELQTVVSMFKCTALLLGGESLHGEKYPEHAMVDGIIELDHERTSLRSRRSLRVTKLRGTQVLEGQHTLEISAEGIVVWPRIETRLRTSSCVSDSALAGRLPFGVSGLDELLHGGVPSCSTTMLVGASGTGKTILGLEFLIEGFRRGETGAYFGLYEGPEAIRSKAARLGLPLDEAIARGAIELVWNAPVEVVIDVLAERLIRVVRERKLRRLFLDGIQGFQAVGEPQERVREVLSVLVSELEANGVTSVYTSESRAILSPTVEIPIVGVSAVTHNIILLNYVEWEARLRRAVSVVKIRDGDFDGSIRELTISNAGVVVQDSFADLSRILTGTPRRRRRAAKPETL